MLCMTFLNNSQLEASGLGTRTSELSTQNSNRVITIHPALGLY